MREVLKLISKTLRHTAVGLNTVPKDVMSAVSDGMNKVLTFFKESADSDESLLTADEKGYMMVAKDKFSKWKVDRSRYT